MSNDLFKQIGLEIKETKSIPEVIVINNDDVKKSKEEKVKEEEEDISNVTQYEANYKPNDVSTHTLYHVRISTLFSSDFSFHLNKEKFMLNNVIVCYLKIQGFLKLNTSETSDVSDLVRLSFSEPGCDKMIQVYFRTGPGYETVLESFKPSQDCLYEILVKPNPREKNSFYAYTIRQVSTDEWRSDFLKRCKVEEDYYRTKSLENKKSLVSHLGGKSPFSSSVSPIKSSNNELTSTVSKHLLRKLDNGRLCQVPSQGPLFKKQWIKR
jgi:hypothetical protein